MTAKLPRNNAPKRGIMATQLFGLVSWAVECRVVTSTVATRVVTCNVSIARIALRGKSVADTSAFNFALRSFMLKIKVSVSYRHAI